MKKTIINPKLPFLSLKILMIVLLRSNESVDETVLKEVWSFERLFLRERSRDRPIHFLQETAKPKVFSRSLSDCNILSFDSKETDRRLEFVIPRDNVTID